MHVATPPQAMRSIAGGVGELVPPLWGAVDVVFVAFEDAQEVFAGILGAAVGVDGEVVGAWGEFGFEPAVGALEAFGAGGGLFEVQVEVGVLG